LVRIEEEIKKKIREIKTKLLRMQMLQNLEANAAFLDVGNKVTENLRKLQLGVVANAINKVMPLVLNKNLDSLKLKNSLRLNEITDEICDDIDQIFTIISKSLNISEEERRALLETPSKEKENIAE
jgi:hypothetical protein